VDWIIDWDLKLLGSAAVRLLLAGLCGGAIGWEREFHKKGAGLRTHMLICSGACLFTIIGLELMAMAPGGDILRLVQGLAIGIGFIGSGVIFSQGASVKGLTTAAGLWMATGVGLAAGMGYKELAILGTVFAVTTIVSLKRVEAWLGRHASSIDDD
jgi:putative Mg2+ transporter-C (MgtC) family protein